MNTESDVAIMLTRAEALVLFEFLSRENERMKRDQQRRYEVLHVAERNVMWVLLGALEKTLVEPFERTYLESVDKARAQVVERMGGWDPLAN